MKRMLMCVLATYFCVSLAQEDWEYRNDAPRRWGEDYPDCNGLRQSPILLDIRDAMTGSPSKLGIQLELKDYDNAGNGTFTNNGYTVNLVFNYEDPDTTPRVELTSRGRRVVYLIQSLHFHWPSEHRIKRFRNSEVLELHIVHSDPQTSETLVLGYLFKECKYGERGMEDIRELLPSLRNVNDTRNVTFAPGRIMPYEWWWRWSQSLRGCDYYLYEGSLTTPPCTEGITWLVYDEALCVSHSQMKAFNEVLDKNGKSMFGNARPLQPRNKRRVRYLSCS